MVDEPMQQPPSQPTKSPKEKSVDKKTNDTKILLYILIPISIVASIAWMKLNQEAPPISQEEKNKAIEQVLGRSIKHEKSISQGEQSYKGKLFSLAYPAYAKVHDRDNPNIINNTNLLEYLRLDSEEPHFKLIVTVSEASGVATLEELSAVKVRRPIRQAQGKQNEQISFVDKLYKEMPIIVDGKAGALFVKTNDGVERSSLFLINGRSYSFSMTGLDASELEKVYGEIMKSVRF